MSEKPALTLGDGSILLRKVSEGAVTAHQRKEHKNGRDPVASFGWGLFNSSNNGGDVYLQVVNPNGITLNAINIDVSYAIISTPPNGMFAEVLCRAAVSRGGPPTFSSDSPAFFFPPASGDFGGVQIYNPNSLNLGSDGSLSQDQFYSVILKTWVPPTGVGSSTSRNVYSPLSLFLNYNDYIVFHMDTIGWSGDVGMQVVLQYA